MASIAVIPARSGSKRIPGKNIRLLAGKPAIAYAIEIALESKLFDKVIVSTEDQEIAKVALNYGALVPFVRSADLSDDFSTTVDVMADASDQLKLPDSDLLCCIYPVTPLLTINRLTQARKVFDTGIWDYVFPALEFEAPIERSFRKTEHGKINFLYPEYNSTRTQDIEKSFHDAGQFYFGKVCAWRQKRPILSGNSTFIELDKHETIDIDQISDWEFLESILQAKFKKL